MENVAATAHRVLGEFPVTTVDCCQLVDGAWLERCYDGMKVKSRCAGILEPLSDENFVHFHSGVLCKCSFGHAHVILVVFPALC